LALSARAADSFWINTGTVTQPPQIDATNFVNFGTIDFEFTNFFQNNEVFGTTSQPFETSDTQNYTNLGSMICTPGWLFDNSPASSGQRMPSANFVNKNGGTISGLDSPAFVILGQANISPLFPSYLWVISTNIINGGLLSIGADGWMKLAGTNITLRSSGLEVAPIVPQGSFNSLSNFFPDVGINDVWWGQTNLNFLASDRIWDGTTATAPPHTVTDSSGFSFTESFSVSSGFFQYISNAVGTLDVSVTNKTTCSIKTINIATNVYLQAVFVGYTDFRNMGVDVSYFPSSSPTNFFNTIAVQITTAATNVISAAPDFSQLYFYDTLAAETNRGNLTNLVSGFSARPANYLLSRVDDGRFAFGFPSANGPPPPDFFCQQFITSTNSWVVTNCFVQGAEYAGYNALVDNLVSEPPSIPAGTVTNLPGRIQIYGQNVDLTGARMRGEGEIIVNANHLVSSANAAIDCENLSYNLGNTNGNLNIQNLAKESVLRMNGNLVAWSGLWTNAELIVLDNWATNGDPSNVVCSVPAPITNVALINYHVLILDADFLLTQKPVLVYDFFTHSTNVVVNDKMILVQNLLIGGQSFTLNGSMTFSSKTWVDSIGFSHTVALTDWVFTNAPDLLYFTNNGTLTIPGGQQAGTAHFGDDGPTSYLYFVNAGSINAASINVNSASFQNNGTLTATVGPLTLAGGAGKLESGQSSSVNDTIFDCATAKFNHYHLSAGGGLFLNVTNALLDAGGGSANNVVVQYGFTLASKPATGDLLGTTFQTQAPDFGEVDHFWAGEDRGVASAGYTNNVALGTLLVGPAGRFPLFFFAGTGAHNGLYVDLLDLTSLGTNFQNLIDIDPSLTIYYAAAKLGFTPPNNPAGIPQEPEEYLDGQFGGHLRWVNSFAGPNSSVDVIINGLTVPVNKALRFSKIIDSNGDGIPNYYDPYPFNAPPLKLTASVVPANPPPARAVAVSWTAAPNTVYQVEFTTNMPFTTWQPLVKYTNAAPNSVGVTITDPSAPVGGARRFYRVRTSN
jgi:hypothetical protein